MKAWVLVTRSGRELSKFFSGWSFKRDSRRTCTIEELNAAVAVSAMNYLQFKFARGVLPPRTEWLIKCNHLNHLQLIGSSSRFTTNIIYTLNSILLFCVTCLYSAHNLSTFYHFIYFIYFFHIFYFSSVLFWYSLFTLVQLLLM